MRLGWSESRDCHKGWITDASKQHFFAKICLRMLHTHSQDKRKKPIRSSMAMTLKKFFAICLIQSSSDEPEKPRLSNLERFSNAWMCVFCGLLGEGDRLLMTTAICRKKRTWWQTSKKRKRPCSSKLSTPLPSPSRESPSNAMSSP